MKRYTGQKALYEAINRSRAKAKRSNILERFLPELAKQRKGLPNAESRVEGPKPPVPKGLGTGLTEAPVEPPAAKEPLPPVLEASREAMAAWEEAALDRPQEPEKAELPSEKPVAPAAFKLGAIEETDPLADRIPMGWRLKPLQLNDGRIEISVSYPVGIAVALAVILVILASFRLGQRFPVAKAKGGVETKTLARAAPPDGVPAAGAEKTPTADAQRAGSPASGATQPQGDNWIVLARHKNEADLEPVVAHFAKNGIALRIYELGWLRQQLSAQGLTAAGLPSGDGFLLVTNDFYVNPQSPGTEGYKMIQKIVSVGASYKAPKGKDPFTPKLFSDAYGMKISRMN